MANENTCVDWGILQVYVHNVGLVVGAGDHVFHYKA